MLYYLQKTLLYDLTNLSHGNDGEYSILLTKPSRYYVFHGVPHPYYSSRACFPFLSPSGSMLPLRFLILISIVLNLISMRGFEALGVITILMSTSGFSWHSLFRYCLDDEVLFLTYVPFPPDDSFILTLVAFSSWRSSPGLTWIAQSNLSR